MPNEMRTAINPENLDRFAGEAAAAITVALRGLYRLHDGDAEAIGQAMRLIDAAARDRGEEPPVIKVESLGAFGFLTLREYIEDQIQDWETGLEDACHVLAEAPGPFIYGNDDPIRHLEHLQLHTAIDEGLLRSEIERLAKEDF